MAGTSPAMTEEAVYDPLMDSFRFFFVRGLADDQRTSDHGFADQRSAFIVLERFVSPRRSSHQNDHLRPPVPTKPICFWIPSVP
jgi:hypothetical protein